MKDCKSKSVKLCGMKYIAALPSLSQGIQGREAERNLYWKGQEYLLGRFMTPKTHVVTLVIPLLNLLTN